jgi:biotin operon repressor
MGKAKLRAIIGNKAHWTINKELVKQLGLTETLVLQHIIDLSESAFKRDEIFSPFPRMAQDLGISEYSIKQAVGKLKSHNLINVQRKSVGYMNFYSVNTDLVLEMMSGSNNSLVRGNSTHQKDEGVGELEIDSPEREYSTLSESKNHALTVENYSAITNNTTNNTEQIINTNNTVHSIPGSEKLFVSRNDSVYLNNNVTTEELNSLDSLL